MINLLLRLSYVCMCLLQESLQKVINACGLASLPGCSSPSVTAAVAFEAAPTTQAASKDIAVLGDAHETGA
jgi:hypothetical protein